MSANYSRFMKLLESWPVDKSKIGRDLGEHLLKQVKYFANPEQVTKDISANIEKQVSSLERIANNIYGKRYKRTSSSTATGLTPEQCNQVLSSEFLQYLNDDKKEK